jgi:outer membrane protein insertion porin family
LPRLRIALLVAFAALAAIPARADDRVRVALLPLVVHAADGREYLQQGMTDMLVSRLGRERRIAVIPIDDATTATTDAAAARKTAAANQAAYVVFGSLTRFGEGASVDLSVASVADASREPRKIYVHADTMGALIPLLDGAAERVAGVVFGGAENVAAGPESDDAASISEIQELRRRVEVLERAVFSNSAVPKTAGTEGGSGAKHQQPGLPSDRDAEPVR